MSKKLSAREVIALVSQTDIEPTDALVSEIRKEYKRNPDAFQKNSALYERQNENKLNERRRFSMKKQVVIILVAILAVASVGGALAYKESKKRQSVMKNESNKNDRVTISMPEGLTRVKIIDGTFGDTITFDGDELKELCDMFNSITGTAEDVGESSGYTYGIMCYRGDERCASFSIMSPTVLNEQIGNSCRLFTSDSEMAVYKYLTDLFEAYRAENK